MCDTIVALPKCTKDGKMLFAKNSDRSPNEPQILQHFKAVDNDLIKNPNLKLTYIEIPQIKHTYEVVLSRPSWMWGAEFGFNEFGLNIGNEAVFTKEKYIKTEGITGMDMLRLALERCKSAYEALEFLIDLLNKYNQGGNCGYDKKFFYHNSFLIADTEDAYVLETAGKYWVWKKIEDYYAISNCLSLEKYDACHSELITHAIKKGWCKSESDFSFVKCYTEPLFTKFSKSLIRRATAMKLLSEKKHDVKSFISILRNHSEKADIAHADVGSICMHAGGLIGDHTTASYVAKIDKEHSQYYVTGSSMPCMSMFKPLVLQNQMPIAEGDDTKNGILYWLNREKLNRYFISGTLKKDEYLLQKSSLENYMIEIFEATPLADKGRVMEVGFDKENQLIDCYLYHVRNKTIVFSQGSISYRNFWRKKTKTLLKK